MAAIQGIYDVHCHMLPGVDDGASSMEETAALLRRSYADGVRVIIVTPHYRRGMFEPKLDRIYRAFWASCDEAAKIAPDLHLFMGCEFHVNMDMINSLKNGDRPTMAGSSYVLSEFDESAPYSFLKERVTALRTSGFRPLIAHAERCDCLLEDEGRSEELVAMGAKIQINAGSILGDMGRAAKNYCRNVLRDNLVACIGSDAHNLTDRKPNLAACAVWLEKKMGRAAAEDLLIGRPSALFPSTRAGR